LREQAGAIERLAAPQGAPGRLPALGKAPLESAGDTLRLKDENRQLRERCAALQQQYSAAMRERAQLAEETDALRARAAAPGPVAPAAPVAAAADAGELAALRQRVSALEAAERDARAAADAATRRAAAAETETAALRSDLEAARREASQRVSETKQFQSLQKMLTSKNELIKSLREELAKCVLVLSCSCFVACLCGPRYLILPCVV
jgi:hypothetical protein